MQAYNLKQYYNQRAKYVVAYHPSKGATNESHISLEREYTQAAFPTNIANTFVWVVPLQKFALRRWCEFQCNNEYHISVKFFKCFKNSSGQDRLQAHTIKVKL